MGKKIGKIAGTVSGALSPVGAIGGMLGGKVGEIGGDLVGKLGGGLPKAKAGTGEAFAQAIKAQPYDISKSAEKFAGQAAGAQTAAEGRQTAVGAQGAALRDQLAQTAAGKGPSLAEAQMKQAQDRNLAQQLAAASSQRGGSPAALQRQLARQQATSGQEIAQQAGVARMQESQAAQQLLGQQVNNEQAAADQAVNNYMKMGFSVEQAQAQALQDLETLRSNARVGGATQQTQASIANAQSQSQLLGGLLGGAASIGGAFAMSDKAQKKNIKKASTDTASFLNALSAQKYDYKDSTQPGTSPGKNYGIMAQDLEKSPMGKSLVVETPQGKMVDTRKGFGAALAGMAELNRRTAELERALKKQKLKKGKA